MTARQTVMQNLAVDVYVMIKELKLQYKLKLPNYDRDVQYSLKCSIIAQIISNFNVKNE